MTPTQLQNITVIGIGKLGLGFALLLEKAGYNVLGVDIFQNYVDQLNAKSATFTEAGYNELLQSATNFQATTDIQKGLDHSDLIFILVQTPNGGGSKFYDHTILSNLLEKINRHRPENKHFIIGCTVMPHYIDQIASPLLINSLNCSISYNPEFIAQGAIVEGFKKPDMILIGTKVPSILTPILTEVYTLMTSNQPIFSFMTPLEAEIVKISLNGFVTTKISFANMISDLCDEAGANKQTVLNAIGADTRIGRKYFQPGLSFGGPCFPRDTRALKQLMDQHNVPSQILQSTTEYNEYHNRVYAKYLVSSNSPQKESVKKALQCSEHFENNETYFKFTDICYKPNVHIPIIEESAKLKVAEILVKDYKKRVVIEDKDYMIAEVKKEYGLLFEYCRGTVGSPYDPLP
jgi:nucleotide sugar dehydrogenase